MTQRRARPVNGSCDSAAGAVLAFAGSVLAAGVVLVGSAADFGVVASLEGAVPLFGSDFFGSDFVVTGGFVPYPEVELVVVSVCASAGAGSATASASGIASSARRATRRVRGLRQSS